MSKRASPDGGTEVLSLNTNISVQLGLQWPMDRAIRELLLNCVDKDPAPKLTREEKDGRWIFKNKGELKIENFTYSTTQTQIKDRMKNGNFGYGLKDAIVILTCLGVKYKAKSNGTTFTARKDETGLLWIHVKKSNKKPPQNCGTVQQILRSQSADLLQQAVEAAKKQVLQFREDITKCPNLQHFQVCSSKDGKVSGMVYLTTNASGSNELFVQNCAYPFLSADRPKPLVFTYNLFLKKAGLRGRDRAGLPENWFSSLTNLIKDSPAEVLDALLNARARNANFYEFGTTIISKYLNMRAEQKREEHRDALAKQAELKDKLQKAQENAAAPDLPTAVQARHAAHVKEIEHSLKKQLKIAARFSSQPLPKPQVLVFRDSVPPPRDDVEFVTISKPHDKLWQEKKIPTLEEYDLMRVSSILPEYLSKVRALQKFLSLMRISTLQMKSAAPSALPIAVQRPALLVNFLLTEEELVSAAIQTLCTPSYFKPAKGMTHEQALARFASSLLRFAPDNPAKISKCQIYEEAFSFDPPVMTGPKPFCPLLVDTAWNTKAGGISAFNIQLAEGLARQGCTVYVAVTDSVKEAATPETQATWDDAKKNGVIIVPLSQTRGNFIPELSASEAASITHIIGHAHITGKAAAQMHKLPQLSHTRLWQFNHVLPREADQLKDYGTPESRAKKGADKSKEITELNEAADFVWSVGQMMFDAFDREFRQKDCQQGKHEQITLPLNPRFLQDHPRKSFGSTVNVLFFGRTEDVYYLKGMDIAQRACEYANNHNTMKLLKKKVHLTVRGLAPNTSVSALLKLLALQDVEHRDFQPLLGNYASQTEILEELKAADIFIMPSRVEPFGLAATEAIAAGVPVLVTDNSGVARELTKEHYPDLCVKTSKYHPDLKEDDIKSDAEAWGEAIVRLVIQGEDTFQRALKLKKDLLQSLKEPYSRLIEEGNKKTKN